MTKTVLHVNKVKKVYGKKGENQSQVLKDVSFSIEEGEFVGIMGPSGSGKTTLLNVISTLDQATEGMITIAGIDIIKMKANELSDFRSQKLGFIFQDFNLLENLSIYENIALLLSLQGKSSRDIETKVQGVTDMLGISSILSKYPAEISGGQKQRTAAARALVHNPAMILADEPTGSLDSKNATSLLKAMQRLNEEQDVSIYKELGSIFVFPAILGLIHVLVGMKTFAYVAIFTDPYINIWVPISIFLIIYTIYYWITVQLYKRIVFPKQL